MPAADFRLLTDATGQRIAIALEGVEGNMTDKLPEDFSTLSALPSAPATGDLLAIASNSTTYKIDYNALETAILDKALRRPSTPVAFGGSEDAFSANIVTLLDSMAPGEHRTISTAIGAATDNFTGYAAYYGVLYKIDSKFATGIMTDNVRSTVLIGRSNSDIVYFSALAKAAVAPVSVGGTGATTAAGARANIGSGCPSGTFTTADGKTVTVTNGFITAIT